MSEREPSLGWKYDFLSSPSRAYLGHPTCFWARSKFGSNLKFVSEPCQAQFVLFGSSGLELQQASLTLSWITLQRLLKMGLTRTKISKLINKDTNWTIQSTWIQIGSCGSNSAHVGKTSSAQKRGKRGEKNLFSPS